MKTKNEVVLTDPTEVHINRTLVYLRIGSYESLIQQVSSQTVWFINWKRSSVHHVHYFLRRSPGIQGIRGRG